VDVLTKTRAYEDCLKTKEWSPLQQGIIEWKYYTPGIGLVLSNMVEDGLERIEFVKIMTG
jgi:hypothetical protein